MSPKIEFTRNYSDQSTDQGYQFEFYCDRCGTGYRTRFQPSTLGTVSNALEAASGLLGGLLGRAADLSERARSATWEKAHDDAFVKAMEELRPDFIQCPRCSSWVCKKSCWNPRKGLCKECAPDIGVEMAAAQASKTRDKVWESAEVAEEDEQQIGDKKTWKAGVRAACPQCNAPLASNVKFCPECGAKIASAAFCAECGAKLTPGAKFCPECGTKAGA
jgi:DNA-directed RNA polymerase subunit M/transcription elongation factor TFIIS